MKVFKQISHYKTHKNKKIPCEDKRASLELQLKIAQESTKQKELDSKVEETKLSIEKEKTKQLKLEKQVVKTINTTNIAGNQNNIELNIKLEQHFHGKLSVGEANTLVFTEEELQNTITKNMRQFLEYMLSTAYNNEDADMEKHKCIVIHDKQLYAKVAGEVKPVSFADISKNVIKDIGHICENARHKSDPSYKCKIMNNPVDVPLTKKKLEMYQVAPKFVKKSLNRNIVKNSLEQSVDDIS